MIYKDEKLKKREYTPLFAEQANITNCNNNISTIIGNHRDPNNYVGACILEFEKNKMIKKALEDILKIKHNTTQHNTTQHNTTQHNTTQHNIV